MSCERDSPTSYQELRRESRANQLLRLSAFVPLRDTYLISMKVSEAKERQGKAIREMYPWLA